MADFGKLTPAALVRIRQSQILAGDPPVKVIRTAGDWRVVQMVDLTCGWVLSKFLERIPDKNYWDGVKRFGPEPVAITLTEEQFVACLKKWPAPRYIWGGRHRLGQDCSGLVQDVFWKTTGYWLPRNSKDQAARGQKIVGAWAVGDLVLMSGRENGISHIGIVSDPSRKIIFHLARRNVTPRFESQSELDKFYKFLSVSRLIYFAPA